MLVIAPPMPTNAVGAGRPSIRVNSDAMASWATLSCSCEMAPARPNFSVKRAAAKSELGASAAGVENCKRTLGEAEPQFDGKVRQPSFFGTWNGLDAHAATLLHHVNELLTVVRGPHSHGADRFDGCDSGIAGL